jgi:hypothetical protein
MNSQVTPRDLFPGPDSEVFNIADQRIPTDGVEASTITVWSGVVGKSRAEGKRCLIDAT